MSTRTGAKGGGGLVATLMSEGIIFGIALGFAWLVLLGGAVLGRLLPFESPAWPTALLLALVVYSHLKHLTRLRLENRRLQMLEVMLRQWNAERRAQEGEAKEGDADAAADPPGDDAAQRPAD